MKIYLALMLAASLLTIPPVRAQTVDIPELSRLYLEEFIVIDAWFSGYYHGKSNTTVIDSNKVAANTHKVLEICKMNPDVTVMQAIEKLSAAGG
jgi:HdeA/HdeB family protein